MVALAMKQWNNETMKVSQNISNIILVLVPGLNQKKRSVLSGTGVSSQLTKNLVNNWFMRQTVPQAR